MTLSEATAVLSKIPDPTRLYRVRDAALLVGLNEETIQRRIRAGEVPAYGYPRRVNLADLLKPYQPKHDKE